MSTRRDAAAARRFFKRAIRTTKVTPIEVVTDRAPAYLTVLDDLLVQNRRRGHYELAVDEPVTRRVAVAFTELALAI